MRFSRRVHPSTYPTPARTDASPTDWSPYSSETQFRLAEFLFRTDEMSAGNINTILELWALSLMKHDDTGPFDTYQQIYEAIDETKLGDAPWKCLKVEPVDTAPDAPTCNSHQSYHIRIAHGMFDPI